jgi:hydrogenase expression/formation protein HypE
VAEVVLRLLDAKIEIHCLRDLTRGGLASALVEIAEAARVGIIIDEAAIPVREDVRGACEILGLDPLHLANEGRFVAFVAAQDTARALSVMKSHPLGNGACLARRAGENHQVTVLLESKIGATRLVEMFSGEQLPRIC